MSYPSIVLFGDSITEYSFQKPSGLSSSLNEAYARKADIVTKGFAGYTTRWAKPLLEPVLKSAHDIRAVVIFLGTNDASVEGPQHVPKSEYISNLRDLAQEALGYTSKIAIVGPTLVDELGSHPGCKTRLNKTNLEYNLAAGEVAKEVGAEFIDLWTLFRTANGEPTTFEQPLAGEKDYKGPKQVKHLVHDGIHFTGEGYEIWYKALQAVLKKWSLSPEDLPYVYPPWGLLVK